MSDTAKRSQAATVAYAVMVTVMVLAPLAVPRGTSANGDESPSSAGGGPSTRFERFVLTGCAPCVQESYRVKSVRTTPVKLPAAPPTASNAQWRQGEITFEVVQAWELGQPAKQAVAARVSLQVMSGAAMGGGLFPLGAGLVDAADVQRVADAIAAIARHGATPPRDAERVDIDVHAGSFRVGVMGTRESAFAYVQVGDIAVLAARPVWDVVSTLFLPVSEVPALTSAMTAVAARMRTRHDH